ncbi:MAG: hypothetical protein ACO29O_08595 [Chitinophagaceae bacterium]
MEVHHPHSHGPKKWKEHFLEFLMLFLAVTLGFFAENLRDQYIEKERAHEYLQHLESDIDNNIHFIDSLIVRDRQMLHKFDSALLYLATAKEIDLDSLYSNLPVNVFRFLSKNDTYEQMKSSGSLRYIKDHELLELILDYSNATLAAESRSTQMETEFATTHWIIAINNFMTKESAIRDYQKNRRGYQTLFKDDVTSELLIDTTYLKIETLLNAVDKSKNIISGNELKTVQSKLIPYLVRRQGLIVNTMRFMGFAKTKGMNLKKYLEEKHF